MFVIRTPYVPFVHGPRSGRWGKLIIIDGPEVNDAPYLGIGYDSNSSIPVPDDRDNRSLWINQNTDLILDQRKFTTIERTGGYVMLRPNCPHDPPYKHPKEGAYTVKVENGNSVVRNLYRGGKPPSYEGPVYHDGKCLRIKGAVTTKEQGILFHEAPHVGWLTGCISPRTYGKTDISLPTDLNKKFWRNESHKAMEEIFKMIGSQTANLWVLDY